MSDQDNNSLESRYNEFISSTIKPNLFQIENVANDNACFYRAFANGLNFSTICTKLNDIKDLKQYGQYKKINNVFNNDDWGEFSIKQDKLARYLQGKSYRYIKKNYSNNLEEYGMDLGTMILLTHDIDIDEYLDRYRYFAGDVIVDEIDTGEIYKQGDNKGLSIIEEIEIDDRWGGTPEQIALSEAYELPIVILTAQKYDKKRDKIINGRITKNKAEKGVRYKIIQVIGKKYLLQKPPIFILWKEFKKMGHYFSLYIKNKKNIDVLVSMINEMNK